MKSDVKQLGNVCNATFFWLFVPLSFLRFRNLGPSLRWQLCFCVNSAQSESSEKFCHGSFLFCWDETDVWLEINRMNPHKSSQCRIKHTPAIPRWCVSGATSSAAHTAATVLLYPFLQYFTYLNLKHQCSVLLKYTLKYNPIQPVASTNWWTMRRILLGVIECNLLLMFWEGLRRLLENIREQKGLQRSSRWR